MSGCRGVPGIEPGDTPRGFRPPATLPLSLYPPTTKIKDIQSREESQMTWIDRVLIRVSFWFLDQTQGRLGRCHDSPGVNLFCPGPEVGRFKDVKNYCKSRYGKGAKMTKKGGK